MKYFALAALAGLPMSVSASGIYLGTAASFAVLAGSTVTNTGPSVINGNVGVSPGSAITGFPPGTIVPPGVEYPGDAVALQAESDLTTAYNAAAGEACTDTLTGQDLGGMTLLPGVDCFASSAQLTGTLMLNAEGNPNAIFLIQIGSTLTTASNSTVVFLNGAQSSGLYWQVGSSATIGTSTAFAGDILALTSITLTTGASILDGAALARNGAVTLDDNDISITPEPSTGLLLLVIGAFGLLGLTAGRKFTDISGFKLPAVKSYRKLRG